MCNFDNMLKMAERYLEAGEVYGYFRAQKKKYPQDTYISCQMGVYRGEKTASKDMLKLACEMVDINWAALIAVAKAILRYRRKSGKSLPYYKVNIRLLYELIAA